MSQDGPTPPLTGLDERLARILDFLVLTDRFKKVERAAYLGDGSRHESDAEHTWHMGLYALLLHEEVGFYVDIGHVLKLVLVHDLVEILAGDTYCYDQTAVAGQEEREREAAQALFGRLPEPLAERLHGWWREFEEGATAEARFAKSMDRLQGFIQNYVAAGKTWKENGIAKERTRIRTDLPRRTDPVFDALIKEIYARADAGGLWGGE
ncbi:MAG TPA: HD domain-containing protein [Azospirillaceae bacterium]|nr:HD domain-containing protein [Azospirillaceae bacterium]